MTTREDPAVRAWVADNISRYLGDQALGEVASRKAAKQQAKTAKAFLAAEPTTARGALCHLFYALRWRFNAEDRRVALYLRAACVSQNDPSAALDRQRRVLLDVVSRYTLEIVAEYSDAPASGLDPERPGLNRLLNDSKADRRTFDIVIVESPSRLSLQASELVEIASELAKQGIQLYRADQGCVIPAAAFSRLGGRGR